MLKHHTAKNLNDTLPITVQELTFPLLIVFSSMNPVFKKFYSSKKIVKQKFNLFSSILFITDPGDNR